MTFNNLIQMIVKNHEIALFTQATPGSSLVFYNADCKLSNEIFLFEGKGGRKVLQLDNCGRTLPYRILLLSSLLTTTVCYLLKGINDKAKRAFPQHISTPDGTTEQ